jgi:hypothetical protein
MSSIKLKGSSSGEAILSTDATAAKVTVDKNVDITGNVVTSTQSQVQGFSDASAVTINSATATTLASVTLTTTGKPVMLTSCGDSNPGQDGGWFFVRLYRDTTEIGKRYIAENQGTTSQNYMFAVSTIDEVAAGTYTYSVKAYQGSGTHTFGETGDVQAATITAHEIL